MGKALDLTGQRFGRLTAIRCVGSKNGRRMWECECECGELTIQRTSSLRSGEVKSCGCRQQLRHGKRHTPEYLCWWRLLNSGQVIPDEWKKFEEFDKDIGSRPSPNHRLARKDGTKPHGKGNTYWRDAHAENELTASDLGQDFVLDLRSLALAEASAREGKESA